MDSIELLIFLLNMFEFKAIHQASGAPDLEMVSTQIDDPFNTLREFVTPNYYLRIVKFHKYTKKALSKDLVWPLARLNERNVVDSEVVKCP